MGFNYSTVGYKDVFSFVTAMKDSERAQLNAFVAFINADPKLHKCLTNGDWPGFAGIYNGPAYADNKYDIKLAAAFKVFSTMA